MEEENLDIDNIEIDKLQQAIANMAEDGEERSEILQDPLEAMQKVEETKEEEFIDDTSEYKKYVLKIHKKYQPIIDKMDAEEKEQYFNAMLDFYLTNKPKIQFREKVKESIIHVTVAVLTCVIGLPLIFFITNKSIELTIANYKQTQENFINLYREKGDIKKKDLTKLRKLK